MTHPNEMPDTAEPFDEGYEWYCPACRSLVVDESVSYEGLHTCGAPVKLLSPDQIIALENRGTYTHITPRDLEEKGSCHNQ